MCDDAELHEWEHVLNTISQCPPSVPRENGRLVAALRPWQRLSGETDGGRPFVNAPDVNSYSIADREV